MQVEDEVLDSTGITLEELDELMGVKEVGETHSTPQPQFARSPRSRTGLDLEFSLFFDIETIPDESRMHTFGLPPVSECKPTSLEECPKHGPLLAKSMDGIEEELLAINPPPEWVDECRRLETIAKKPRKGVFELLDKVAKSRDAAAEAEDKRTKLLSTTPEFCRIVALGWASGAGQVQAKVTADERSILEFFWEAAAKATHFVGYNVLAFDIPVILFRSALLGVDPTCVIERSPWGGGKVVDLMVQRFGRMIPSVNGKLKDQARLYGVDVPAGETSGADVYGLWKEGRESEIAAYVCSDVEVERELFHRMSGYWFF